MEIETHQDQKRIDDLEARLNLTRKENSIFKSDISKTIGEQNDAFRTELNKTVADINKLIGNSSNECLEFKTEITKTLKEQKSTLEHLQNKANKDQKSISELKSRLDVSVKDYSTFKTDISKTVKEYNDACKKDLNNRIADINKLLSKSANEVLAFKNEIAKTLNEHKVNLNRLENNTLEYQKRQETQLKNLWENGSLDKKSDWTIVLRRQDGSVNFNRNWADYKAGFGNLNSEFFIGMEALHNLTSNGSPHEMVITLKDFNGVQTFARYDDIVIGSEKEQYELKVLGVHSGNADDSLRHHEGEKFTTRDRDNDNSPKTNCAETFKGPWWYYQCNPSSQLFGPYEGQAHGQRLRWSLNKLHDLKYVEVKIKIKINFHMGHRLLFRPLNDLGGELLRVSQILK
ncbi:techylectin-5B [Musca domestica]|uniref:Techylectin-5B n=1 Tax=Musca domestica TaxID=7370 RepID=A0A9J7CPZ5_MUSDO|nr:techylectin-5B [Musca domestica]